MGPSEKAEGRGGGELLRITGLSKTFFAGTPNEVAALRGLDLSVAEGDFLVVIGTNGSGKSTLLNAVAGSFAPDAGSIRLAGRDITRLPEFRRAKMIARVFQNPFSGTAPNMSIAENLSLAARRGKARGLGRALPGGLFDDLKALVADLGMDLENRLVNEIGTLSGGQRQALTLLMATLVKPELLLLDEHTAALDPKAAELVIRLTHKIVTRNRLTTIMVTHSMQQAVNLGNRLILMHRGRILHDFSGIDKKRLRVEDLLNRFDEVRRMDQLDPSAAELLSQAYL